MSSPSSDAASETRGSTDPAGSRAARRQIASRTVRGMAWMAAGGLALSTMNALMRLMTLELDPLYAQFLRYLFAIPMLFPMVWRDRLAAFRTGQPGKHALRGLMHAAALWMFFLALPHLPLADVTAFMFTTPIFVLLGAALVLRESVSAARWLAAAVGLLGVLIVLWPHLKGTGGGWWGLVMLASSPLFAVSFLINKSLTGKDSPGVIVMWQNILVALFTLPLALSGFQALTMFQLGIFVLCGLLGTLAHLCMTRAFTMGDISAMQPMRFLDLIWASLLGLAMFGTAPTPTALIGGAVIVASTIWIARRESAR